MYVYVYVCTYCTHCVCVFAYSHVSSKPYITPDKERLLAQIPTYCLQQFSNLTNREN